MLSIARGRAVRVLIDRLFGSLAAIVVVIFATMMALVFLQVVNRYLIGQQIFWTEEVVRMLLVWCVMIGLPVVLYRRQEIKVELFVLPARSAERLRGLLAVAASVLFCAILAYWGFRYTLRALPTVSPTLGISRAWLYVPIPLGAGLGIIALLLRPTDAARLLVEAAPSDSIRGGGMPGADSR
jgi:TRAP-type transport system small permease protein